MNEELMTKKELLARYGISYGALYRWKRMGLIPEEWFIKRSASTGQETYFDRAAITERVETILSLKDTMSLEEIAERFRAPEEAEAPQSPPVLRIIWRSGEKNLPIDTIVGVYAVSYCGEVTEITESIKEIVEEALENE